MACPKCACKFIYFDSDEAFSPGLAYLQLTDSRYGWFYKMDELGNVPLPVEYCPNCGVKLTKPVKGDPLSMEGCLPKVFKSIAYKEDYDYLVMEIESLKRSMSFLRKELKDDLKFKEDIIGRLKILCGERD